MKRKLKVLTLSILLSFSTLAISEVLPSSPSQYSKGPEFIKGGAINLTASERAAFSLYGGTLQIFESLIHATSCSLAEGSYSFTVKTNGAIGTPATNEIKLLSPDGGELLIIRAEPLNPSPYRGQNLLVVQLGKGAFKGAEIEGFSGTVSFNNFDNLMVSQSTVKVKADNGEFDEYQLQMIKDYNLGNSVGDHHIYDWGLESVSKLEFPVEKYWQRSKFQRDNDIIGRTIIVKDRIVGISPCRIVMDSTGLNNQNIYSQSGTLTVSSVIPKEPMSSFDDF